MLKALNKLVILTCGVGIVACTPIDDYMLGKDNTAAPTPLEKIKPEMNLVAKWQAPIGQGKGADANLKLTPVAHTNGLYAATNNGEVAAVSYSSGKPLWMQNIKQSITAGPTVSNGIVVVASDNDTITALKETDGSVLWSHRVSGDVLAKPIIHQGKVIVKTIEGNVYALSAANGKKIWAVSHGAPNIILKASSSPVIINNDLMLVAFSDGKMDAIDLQTGNVIWSRGMAYALGSSDVERLVDIDATPIVEGKIVYLAGFQGYVGALSLTDGEFVWKKPASTYKNITIRNQVLYMTDSSDVVWALNKNSGQVLWKQVDLKARGLTEPVVWGNRVVVGDKYGFVHVLSTQTGKITSRATLKGPVYQAPVVMHNDLFVESSNGLLTRLGVS